MFDVRPIVRLGNIRATGRRIQDGQYLATEAVLRRLYGLDQPGVVLADEVGLGKTYVALGAAAWVLRNKKRSRVLILTNSGSMVQAWADRWGSLFPHGWTRPEMQCLGGYEDYAVLVKDPAGRLAAMSYESLKRFSADWGQIRVDIGAWLLNPRHRPGIRLSPTAFQSLKRDLRVRANGRARPLSRAIPDVEGLRWWRKHFDRSIRQLRDASEARSDLEDMELRYQPILGGDGRRYKFDLVIVDEAHRFDSPGRRQVVELLLKGAVRKFLHVTATPFALSVGQLERLLETFGVGLGQGDYAAHERDVRALGLHEFERCVGLGEPVPQRDAIERGLRRWVVRRTWEEETRGSIETVKERRTVRWNVEPDAGSGFIAALALERAIAELHREGKRTHIASRRTSLCSSWSSALASLEEATFGSKSSPAERFRRLAVDTLLPVAAVDSRKVRVAAERIAALVRSGRKVLVFADRKETLSSLRRQLVGLLRLEEALARTQRKRLLTWYRNQKLGSLMRRAEEFGGEGPLRALLASIAGRRAGKSVDHGAALRYATAWLKASGENTERLGWLGNSFEGGRSVRSVEIYDGERGDISTVNRFNLPGTPWVLLCSRKGQESIDLHVECNTVVLFDPVWNPAHREQRIGRVQRIGSRFRSVDVIDVVTEGTYEEYTYRRAMARARMMRVLLGAGRWLDEDSFISDPERYRINLSPRSRLEDELKQVCK